MLGTACNTAMRCNTWVMSSKVAAALKPFTRKASDVSTTDWPLPKAKASIKRNTWVRSALPSIWRTAASCNWPPP
jgi:hypothetical protein